jgi:hypothetical protein
MDTKIQKYARRCEGAAWALISLAFLQWIGSWIADFVVAYTMGDIDFSKYETMAEVFGKLSAEQLHKLNFVNMALAADWGGAWFGLFALAKLSWKARLLGFLCDGVGFAIMVIGFYFFIKLMKELQKGLLFSLDVIQLLNKIAKLIFWFAVYTPINRTIITLILSLANPPGQRLFTVSFTFGDLFTLAASWFFVILTSLMVESRELQSEHDLTV